MLLSTQMSGPVQGIVLNINKYKLLFRILYVVEGNIAAMKHIVSLYIYFLQLIKELQC